MDLAFSWKSKDLANSALFFATMSEMLLPFVRSVALARILPPEQFGLGVTLSVVYGIAEQSTDIGVNFSAVRAGAGGGSDKRYGTLQALNLTRGAVLAAILCATSPIMAMAFHAPQATLAYALLGVSMLIWSFANLGVKEAMRSYQYWREASVVGGSQLFWTLLTIYAACQLKSFNAVIIGVIGNVVAYVVISHWFSPRPWRLSWNKIIADEAISFGRPLIPNGAANAFIQLGDRFVIGSVLGVVHLAIYNVAMVTALLPRNAVAKFLITLFMPAFVNLGPERAREVRLLNSWTLLLSTCGFSYGIGLISIGPELINLIFGHIFQPTALVMGLIAVNICAKFLDQLPIPASLAYGHTRFIFFGTIASAGGVAIAIAVLVLSSNFESFIGALAIGQALALAWITERSIRLLGFRRYFTWFTVAFPVAVLSALVAVRALLDMPLITWVAVSWTVGVLDSRVNVLRGDAYRSESPDAVRRNSLGRYAGRRRRSACRPSVR